LRLLKGLAALVRSTDVGNDVVELAYCDLLTPDLEGLVVAAVSEFLLELGLAVEHCLYY
jgi:hypothetical protein